MEQESLDHAVNEVYRLNRDLSARVILQEEEGYSETVPAEVFWAYGNWSVPCDQDCWVVTRPEESVPDNEKRDSAKNQLIEIFKSSKWYSARYAAGIVMFNESQFRDNISLWMHDIRKGLNASSGPSSDNETRVSTVRDIAKLYSLSGLLMLEEELKDVYANNCSENARKEAGKQLGYSNLRITIHEFIR